MSRGGATRCLFATDLHGSHARYATLLQAIAAERPAGVFLGGDLFGHFAASDRFSDDDLGAALRALRAEMGPDYPAIFAILGNDDPRTFETALARWETERLLVHLHGRSVGFRGYRLYGYACVPPTPFALKDWERYDVSRFVDPGAVSPEEGRCSAPVDAAERRWATIADDLERLAGSDEMDRAVFLFHTPPYRTTLDRAALDGRLVDHVPLDVHVGSIAVRRFIERRQPWITFHGHVHESARLTGAWTDRIERTYLFGAAHDGPELCLVRIDLEHPELAARELLGARRPVD